MLLHDGFHGPLPLLKLPFLLPLALVQLPHRSI